MQHSTEPELHPPSLKRAKVDPEQQEQELDPRLCPSWLLLRCMHRLLLLCPVLGLPREFEGHCVRVKRSVVEAITDCSNKKPLPDLNMYTWKARGSRLVTIMQIAPTTTVVWDQASGTCFKAAPSCALGPGCPPGSCFLGQVVMDRMIPKSKQEAEWVEDWKINVLVFDVQSLGAKNFMTHPIPAAERYALLRDLEDSDGAGTKGVFVSQCMKVQWAGNLSALREFRQKEGPALSHIIDCFVRLGSLNPCHDMGLIRCSQD